MKYSLPALLALAWAGLSMAGEKSDPYWLVDDLRPGMKGTGRTVMVGTKIEPFDVEILGVLKNTSPGRDMVLARLSGLNLERTGVIAGMSGSPVTIDGRLLGAVAYAWQFGKEPIAGITPFRQMKGFVEAYEERDRIGDGQTKKVSLSEPFKVNGQTIRSVAVSSAFDGPNPVASNGGDGDELWMMPLQTPVAASGFGSHSLKLFRENFGNSGLLPVMGGAAPARLADEARSIPLEPGGSMALAMVTGDFDMSGIGTVTAVEGDRVYGWGHPFMGLGSCEFPMMTGWVHTVYPRQTVSFKMGSPLRTVGVVTADVSTCIAGTLDRKPDMLPVTINVRREVGGMRTFNVQVVRQRSMLQSLLFTCLTNAVDMEGELPEEMTADIELKIELQGRSPIVLRDTFSGATVAGNRAPTSLYFPISQLAAAVHNNPFGEVRITGITCETVIRPDRITAEIESTELDADTVAPGETLKAVVHLRPWKSEPARQRIEMKIPSDLPDGNYSLVISDDITRARNDLRDRPDLNTATTLDNYLKSWDVVTAGKRTVLAARVALKPGGVSLSGQPLPNLPPGMVQLLGQTRKTGTQMLGASISARQPTDWVIVGTDTVNFTVARKK